MTAKSLRRGMTGLSPAAVSEHMASIRKRDTRPELVVRRLVSSMGYRYRLYRRDLPGTPDLVLASRRKVILVHGCFWHRHDCPTGRKSPSANPGYRGPKLARNVARLMAALCHLSTTERSRKSIARRERLNRRFAGRRRPASARCPGLFKRIA